MHYPEEWQEAERERRVADEAGRRARAFTAEEQALRAVQAVALGLG